MVGHPAYTRRWLQIRAQSWFESKWGYQRIKLVVSKLTSYLFDLTNNYKGMLHPVNSISVLLTNKKSSVVRNTPGVVLRS